MHQHLSRMSLREKVAQMVFIDFRFDDADYDRTMRLVKKEGVGGVRLFGGSIFDIPGFVNSLQRVAKFPLLVAAEYKDGAGWEVAGATAFPPIAPTEELSQLKGRHTAMEARALGVRWLRAPDCSPTPDVLDRAFVKGLHSVGVLACVKGGPRASSDYAAEVDAIVEAGLTSEMTDEIRGRLNPEGLVCVDLPPLQSDRESVGLAVRAGADVLLASGDPDLAIQVLEDEVKAGRRPEASIDRSVERILAAKERLGLFADRMTDVASVETVVGGMMARMTGQRIAEASGVMLVKGGGRIGASTAFLKIWDKTEKCDFSILESELAKRVTLTESAETCVIAFFSSGLKNAQLWDDDKELIRQAVDRYKEVIVINLGSWAREFHFAKSLNHGLAVAPGVDPFSQRVVAKALVGEVPFKIVPEDYFEQFIEH